MHTGGPPLHLHVLEHEIWYLVYSYPPVGGAQKHLQNTNIYRINK